VSEISEKLAKLGLSLPSAITPFGAYVPAVRVEKYIFTSGQLPFEAEELRFRGKVGSELTVDQGYEAAKLCALNCLAAVNFLAGDLEKVEKIVRLQGYIACTPDFTEHSNVINGASDLLVALFGEDGRHARSVIGVYTLPMNAAVEVKLVATLRQRM